MSSVSVGRIGHADGLLQSNKPHHLIGTGKALENTGPLAYREALLVEGTSMQSRGGSVA